MLLRVLLSVLVSVSIASAQNKKEKKKKGGPKPAHRWNRTDIGPVFSASLKPPANGTFKQVPKTIAVRVGEDGEAGVAFDTDNLRWHAAWTGGFVRINPGRDALLDHHSASGVVRFASAVGEGWSRGGEFRPDHGKTYLKEFGPLPPEHAQYRGLYLHGKRVVLSYTVGKGEVLESPWLEGDTFSRDFHLRGVAEKLLAVDAERAEAVRLGPDAASAEIVEGGRSKWISVAGGKLEVDGKRVLVVFPEGATSARLTYGDQQEPGAAADLPAWTKGGPRRWTETLTGSAELDPKPSGAFAYDTVVPPFENPWNAIMHFGGHDVLPNGDIVVCTMEGDVYRVGGLGRDPESPTWQRIATGLYHPLGLRVRDGDIFVLGRDQITRLVDLNGDGETDFYECFNNACRVGLGAHGYSTCLESDEAGNFYYIRCASDANTGHNGTVLKVPADGHGIEVVCTGFRNPNGFFVGPGGVLSAGDQQGTWVPASRLDIMEPGGFYGFMKAHHRATPPEGYDGPLCWIPHKVDNSCGGQVWVPEDAEGWGPLRGRMIHFSYGRCEAFLVLQDDVDGVLQGGVVRIPGRFRSGAMRGRFRPQDGGLWVTGLRGWQTSAPKDGCLQRLRPTGEPFRLPVDLRVHSNGFVVGFTDALDRELAEDPGSWTVKHWNYRWTSKYGSKDWKVSNPDQEGRDSLEVTGAELLPDGRSVFVRVEGLVPVMQMEIAYDLEDKEGEEIIGAIHNTVHRLRPAR